MSTLTSFEIDISLIQTVDKRRFGNDICRIQLVISSDEESTGHAVER